MKPLALCTIAVAMFAATPAARTAEASKTPTVAPATAAPNFAAPDLTAIHAACIATRPGIAIGTSLEIGGLVGFATTMFVAFADHHGTTYGDIVLGYAISGGAFILGSLISSVSYGTRQKAYLAAGADLRPDAGTVNWYLFFPTLALYGVALVSALDSMDKTGFEDIGPRTLSFLCMYGSALAELMNITLVRSVSRRRALRHVEAAGRLKVALAPFGSGLALVGAF